MSNEDNRFKAIQTDPRFKLPKKKSLRGELDSRFNSALKTDERFRKKAHIDRYGKKVKKKGIKEELSKYYNFEEDENGENGEKSSDDDSDEDEETSDSSVSDNDDDESSDSSSDSEDSSATEKSASKKSKSEAKTKKPSMRDLIRGEGVDSSSSSDDDSSDSSSEDEEDEDLIKQRDEYERVRAAADSVPQGDESKRLAVVNMDWDNITSTDLMATFSSFVPLNHSIISVKIYPSEYGKKQMAVEETNGPAQDLFDELDSSSRKEKKNNSKSQSEFDDDQDYSSSKLRRYQLQRLQYYYAVVECDSVECASAIYKNCDGTEYESTANFFDLRFIPDEVDFSNDTPRDECFKVPESYQPSNFTTDALQHSKVKLTWDETPKERAQIAQKAFSSKDIEADDLKAYIASDSDEEDEATIAQKYRSLLMGENKDADAFGEDKSVLKDDNGDQDAVEITFNPVLDGKEAKLEIIEDSTSTKPEDNPEDNLSTIEKYRLKEKQRKLRRMEKYKARKASENENSQRTAEADKLSLELLAMDDDLVKNTPEKSSEDNKKPDKKARKLTKRAAKKKAEEEAESEFDTADTRFQALYEDPDFAIDTTIPQFKKTKGMEKIIAERRKRQNNSSTSNNYLREKEKGKSKRKSEQPAESTEALVSKLRRKHGN